MWKHGCLSTPYLEQKLAADKEEPKSPDGPVALWSVSDIGLHDRYNYSKAVWLYPKTHYSEHKENI